MTRTQKEQESFSIKYRKNIYQLKQCKKQNGSGNDPKSSQVECPLRE